LVESVERKREDTVQKLREP